MRKIFTKVHLWLSIPFGIIIAIVCLTGAVLVFETEILELCYPSRYFVEEVKEKPLPPDALIASARRQLPDSIQLKGLRVFPDPERTWQIVLPGKKAAAFIDPYTGVVTGVDDGKGFFMQMMRLHRWLLDENKRDGSFFWGKAVVGYATWMLVVITISGIVAWYPRNRNVLRNRLRIKTGAGWRRFFYDCHIAGGFYAALLLLVMSLTGLTWSFGWYRDAFYAVFGVSANQPHTHAPSPAASKETPEHGEGNRKGRSEKKTDYTQWADVLSDLQSRYDDYKSITIQEGSATVSAARYGNTRGSDRYSFDPSSGRITDVQLYKDLPDTAKIRGWIYSAHVGSWGGLATRVLACLVSLLGAIFVFTGYYFWIKKKMRACQPNRI